MGYVRTKIESILGTISRSSWMSPPLGFGIFAPMLPHVFWVFFLHSSFLQRTFVVASSPLSPSLLLLLGSPTSIGWRFKNRAQSGDK